MVEPNYEKERSKPEQSLFVFSYVVSIRNTGDIPFQILKRSWTITDAFFNVEIVEGEGVVGQQPLIMPNESFSYESSCPLKTSFGTMKGHYVASAEEGKNFNIEIPEFILAHPHAVQ